MSLGNDLAAALPELRAQAESMMLDTCVITDGAGEPTWDEASGSWVHAPGGTLYEGKCRVTMQDLQPGTAEAGDATYVVSRPRVDLPISSPGPFPVGAVVTFTALGPATDPALLTSALKVVQETSKKSYATARRLACVEVTRG